MFSFKNWSLRSKVIVPSIVTMLILAAGLGYIINKQQRDLAVSQANRTAQAIAKQIEADRMIYTQKVVEKLKKSQVDFLTGDMKSLDNPKTIPLPASFVHLTSDVVNKAGFHQADLLSIWNINPSKKPRNTFEQLALEKVINARDTFPEGVIEENGQTVYKRVSADVASAQLCVDCHNNLETSPRKDFRLNDVMGAMVITLPLDKPFQEAQSNAVTTTLILLGVFALVLVIIAMIQIRYVSAPLMSLEKAADRISTGEMDEELKPESTDEVGKLTSAFERMRLSLKQAMEAMDKEE